MDNNYPKILIVDDERGLRLGTEKLLTRKGFNVSTAENGTEGINKGLAEDFDIAKARGIGFEIIRSLCRQISADLSYNSDEKGSSFKVTFANKVEN